MSPDRIRLRHLRTFVAIAVGGSLVKAAEALSITQPAVTKTLAELEEIVGARLVVRSSRGARLTHQGEIFFSYAGSSLRTLGEGLDAIVNADVAYTHPLAVGALPGVGATILPRAVKAHLETSPRARLRVFSGSNTYLMTLLQQGELDVVIGRMAAPSEMRGLTFEQLYAEPLAFVVRPRHPLLSRAKLSPEMLLKYPLLMPPKGTRTREPAESFFVAAGLPPPEPVVVCIDPSFSRAYVTQTDTIWCAPEGVVENEVGAGALIRLKLNTAVTSGEVGLTIRADRMPSMDLHALMQRIRDASRQLHPSSARDERVPSPTLRARKKT
jgi:LysR family transcriptional regulator, pca operon transcriptional activator